MRRMPKKATRGIVMVVALITLLVITMLVAAAATAMPTQLFAASHGGETQSALMAARSGVDYAYARLQENRSWRGGEANTVVVNTPTLRVVEDRGNVIGLITQADGSKSAFRLKFSFQNAGGSPDEGFAVDPAVNHRMKSPFLCFNNVNQAVGKPLFKADNNGQVVNTQLGTLPKFTCQIHVEGMAGAGLQAATTETLQTVLDQPGARRAIYFQRIACHYCISGITQIDSVVAAANNFSGQATDVGGKMQVKEAPGATAPKIRTRTNANLTQGTMVTTGEVRVDDLAGSSVPGASPIQENASLQDSRFLKVKTNQVTKADASNTRLKAGTYVWRQNGGNYQLDYYAQNYDGSTIPSGPPTDSWTGPGDNSRFISNGSGIVFDKSNMAINIDDKIFVNPQSGGAVKDLAILIEPAVQSTLPIRPTVNFAQGASNPGILSSTGNLTVYGSLDGFGGVTSEQDIAFQGASSFQTDPLNSICLYSQGDINVSSIPDPVVAALVPQINTGMQGMGMGMKTGYKGMGGMESGTQPPETISPFAEQPGDVTLAGIIYALGDFNVNLTTSADPTKHGNFYMEGVLAAFGGNPDLNQTPGFSGKGRVNVRAKNSELYFDPSFLQQLQGDTGGAAPISLQQVSWNLLP